MLPKEFPVHMYGAATIEGETSHFGRAQADAVVATQGARTPLRQIVKAADGSPTPIESDYGTCRLEAREGALYAIDVQWAADVWDASLRLTPYPTCVFKADAGSVEMVALLAVPVHGATRAIAGIGEPAHAAAVAAPVMHNHVATVCKDCIQPGDSVLSEHTVVRRVCKRCGKATTEDGELQGVAFQLPATGPCSHGRTRLTSDGHGIECLRCGKTIWRGEKPIQGHEAAKAVPKGWHR